MPSDEHIWVIEKNILKLIGIKVNSYFSTIPEATGYGQDRSVLKIDKKMDNGHRPLTTICACKGLANTERNIGPPLRMGRAGPYLFVQ